MMDNVRAVIDSAKTRDRGRLEARVRALAPEATPDEIRETVASLTAVVDSVPALLALADQEAELRGLSSVVRPLLQRAVRYFLAPVDVVPEMTQGLAGLIDDAYVSFKVLEHLNNGPQPLFRWEFDEPLRLLRRGLEADVARELDERAVVALEEVSDEVNRVWVELARDA